MVSRPRLGHLAGFKELRLLDFERPVTESCLFCHAGNAKFTDADKRRVDPDTISGITCERCHGDGQAHIKHPSAANIVNPAKLTGAARDSVCEQCHLEGETRIVNPGKAMTDFRAGEKLENTVATYLFQETGETRPAVSQVEELAASQCSQMSGTLWCGTCHDPHGERVNRTRQVEAVCRSCHTAISRASHPTAITECVSCHMPARTTTNIAHVAVTDHRIRRPREKPQASGNPAGSVWVWRQPPEEVRRRDLALAQLRIGSQRHKPDMIRDGVQSLESLPEKQQSNDADALSLLQSIYLKTAAPAKAVALSEWAVAAAPNSATFAMNLGIACKRAGNAAHAEEQLLRAIALDPSMTQAYAELAVLYDEQNRPDEARKIIDRFLAWNPQSIQFRLARQP